MPRRPGGFGRRGTSHRLRTHFTADGVDQRLVLRLYTPSWAAVLTASGLWFRLVYCSIVVLYCRLMGVLLLLYIMMECPDGRYGRAKRCTDSGAKQRVRCDEPMSRVYKFHGEARACDVRVPDAWASV